MSEDTCTANGRCMNPFHNHSKAPALSDLVTTDDPAFAQTAAVLIEMRDAGVTFTPDVVDIAIKLGRLRHERQQEPDQAESIAPVTRRHDRSAGPVVYYVRRGHVIKIGTTTNLVDRMNVLMPDEILAVEPGDRALERERHLQFATLRVHGNSEHFYPGPDLAAHIAAVRAEHGRPDPQLPSLDRAARRRQASA